MSVGRMLGLPENSRTYEDSPRLALARCLTGIEFEAENVRKRLPEDENWAALWTQEPDNSLRENGMEFVLKDPLFGADLCEAVSSFCKFSIKNKFESNYRTGLHVHVDCRNLEINQLVAMVIYYSLYEKVIFKWVGDNREGSIFCLPFYKADGIVDIIGNALSSKQDMKAALPGENDRYAAFNLNALGKYGSIEWRHLQTTFDEERIFKWINCAQSFKKYAKHNPVDPWELLADLSKVGPKALLAKIVGKDFADELWYDEADTDIWRSGLPIAQDLCVLLDSTTRNQWDTTRSAIKLGTNLAFMKWAEKKKNLEEFLAPANIFLDPNLFNDEALQREAQNEIYRRIRQLLDENRFN